MILQFNYNNEIIDVHVTKKKIKNIYIKLDTNNNVVVSAPITSSETFISNFINKHLEKFADLQKKNLKNNNIDLENKTFYLFGQLESFEILETVSQENKIINYFVFRNKKQKMNKKTIKNMVLDIYKKELILYLNYAQYQKEKIMNVEHHDFSIRIKQNAWASNYVEKKKINYSTKLAAFSHDINYVIVHELSHAEHFNHSQEFWEKVLKFEPNFKVKKNKLKSFIYF